MLRRDSRPGRSNAIRRVAGFIIRLSAVLRSDGWVVGEAHVGCYEDQVHGGSACGVLCCPLAVPQVQKRPKAKTEKSTKSKAGQPAKIEIPGLEDLPEGELEISEDAPLEGYHPHQRFDSGSRSAGFYPAEPTPDGRGDRR